MEKTLIALAQKEFEFLSLGEQIFFEQLTSLQSVVDLSNRPTHEQTIRAICIEWLCFDMEARSHLSDRGFEIRYADIAGDLYLNDLKFNRPIRIYKSRIRGTFDLSFSDIEALTISETYFLSLNIERISVKHDLLILNSTIRGTINAEFASIGDNLECQNTNFEIINISLHKNILKMDRIKVGGCVNLSRLYVDLRDIRLYGMSESNFNIINLDDSTIHGNFIAEESVIWGLNQPIDNSKANEDFEMYAISMNHSIVNGSLFFSRSDIKGVIALNNSRFDKDISFKNCKIEAYKRGIDIPQCLLIQSSYVGLDLFLNIAYAGGNVNLSNTTIGKSLLIKDTLASNADTSLILKATIAESLVLSTEDNCWPENSGFDLDRFDYKFLKITQNKQSKKTVHFEVDQYRNWLKGQKDDLNFDAYSILAKALRNQSKNEIANQIFLEQKKNHRKNIRKQSLSNWTHPFSCFKNLLSWLFSCLLSFTVGYGYAPHRSVIWFILFFSVGVVLFRSAAYADLMQPSSYSAMELEHLHMLLKHPPKITEDDELQLKLSMIDDKNYPRFNPWIYTLDTFVPVIDLQQEKYWVISYKEKSDSEEETENKSDTDKDIFCLSFNLEKYCPDNMNGSIDFNPQALTRLPLRIPISNESLRLYLAVHIIIGWILTSLTVAALTGFIKTE